MTFNKPLKTAIAFLLFVSTSSMTKAATVSTAIKLSYTYAPYVKLTGTAPGTSRFYNNKDLVNSGIAVPVNLGTMGLASNVSGLCDIDFSTQNTFRLIHTVLETNLSNYSILYRNITFNATNTRLTIPCNTAPTDIDFKLTGFVFGIDIDNLLAAGVYRDVVKVEVTTQ